MTAMSSAGFRDMRASEGGASRIRAERACAPRLPAAMPNSSRVPAFTPATPEGRADACRKTSWPSSELMNPNPLSSS